jgi:hypothetical protein
MLVLNSAIVRNEGSGPGGISNRGTLTVLNTTVADNVGQVATGGISNGGTLTLINTTVADNQGLGTGDLSGGGTLINTILARNTADPQSGGSPDCSGPVTSPGAQSDWRSDRVHPHVATRRSDRGPGAGPLAR